MTRVYFNVCCLNRPYNDQTQDRIRLETAAILTVLRQLEQEKWIGISSSAVETEVGNDLDLEHRAEVQKLANLAQTFVLVEQSHSFRALELQALGFGAFDALHVACAEAAGADVLLTVDDRFLRLASRLRDLLTVKVVNPTVWLLEILNNDR